MNEWKIDKIIKCPTWSSGHLQFVAIRKWNVHTFPARRQTTNGYHFGVYFFIPLITNETIDIYIITSIIVNTKTTTTDILKVTLLLLSTTDGNIVLNT